MVPTRIPLPARQRGIVLVTALLFLVVVTVVVVSLSRTTILEERMAANNRDWNVAFQAAESALRDGEREVKDGTRIAGQTGFAAGCSSTSSIKGAGLCTPNLCTDTSSNGDCTPIWVDLANKQNDSGWKTGSGTSKSVQYGAITGAAALTGVAAQPRYIVEVLSIPDAASVKVQAGQPSQKYLYRVTAVGFGADVKSRVMLQGIYRPY